MFKRIFIVMILGFMALAGQSEVFAEAKYSIKTMTPEVEKALESRKGRFEQISSLKAQGVIGENMMGYVEVLDKSNSEAMALVDAENADRKVIYQTIAQQNGLTGEMGTIEKVFGQVQRDKAKSGEMVQQENGDWIKK
ncbi:MAG: hypothetical protein A2Z88_03060 [Omnitrophica WOR_2 bacterium GWA2_47_8]|nr:MAG: hypothetical protein A2Z88_03060 [Omnitrophica WOR_2 bacterium GWA2_47_8]